MTASKRGQLNLQSGILRLARGCWSVMGAEWSLEESREALEISLVVDRQSWLGQMLGNEDSWPFKLGAYGGLRIGVA